MIFKIGVVIIWISNFIKQQLIRLYRYLFGDENVPKMEIISRFHPSFPPIRHFRARFAVAYCFIMDLIVL